MPGSRIATLIGAAVISAVAMFIVMMISLFFVVSAVDPMNGRPLDGGLLMMGGIVRAILILPLVALIYFFAARWQGGPLRWWIVSAVAGYVLSLVSWAGHLMLVGSILDPLNESGLLRWVGFLGDGAIIGVLAWVVARLGLARHKPHGEAFPPPAPMPPMPPMGA